ncbi:hypothetical protein [Synechocystis sp. LKSZ1]|uniref:hypothetical protein n=1 Tax=Synechocystis sp. LKSZ1 TaxID=3144951 RepID=UPI00336C18E7
MSLSSAESSTAPRSLPETTTWMYGAGCLAGLLLFIGLLAHWRLRYLRQQWQRELHQGQKWADQYHRTLAKLQSWEQNPDLRSARHFTLAYLRMRLDEENFHYAVIHQMRQQLTRLVQQALQYPTEPSTPTLLVDATCPIYAEVEALNGQWQREILLRLQMQLSYLPTQSSSVTVEQIITTIITFLDDTSPSLGEDRASSLGLHLHWDELAYPIPTLVVTQATTAAHTFQQYFLPEVPSLPADLDCASPLSATIPEFNRSLS